MLVTDGTGSTWGANDGLGNLIVGYDEGTSEPNPDDKGGSHNLVVGPEHTYRSYGGDQRSGIYRVEPVSLDR